MRTAKPHRMEVPSRSDILAKLKAIMEGSITREDANDWAAEYIHYDYPQIYPEVEDPLVSEGIGFICGINLLVEPNVYLHSHEDIQEWMNSFERKEFGNR